MIHCSQGKHKGGSDSLQDKHKGSVRSDSSIEGDCSKDNDDDSMGSDSLKGKHDDRMGSDWSKDNNDDGMGSDCSKDKHEDGRFIEKQTRRWQKHWPAVQMHKDGKNTNETINVEIKWY